MIDNRLIMLGMIVRHGTVTAAAQALHYSPSTVSHQVRQLSGELNVQLLETAGRHVRPTPAAIALLKHVDVMATEWERALADLDEYVTTVVGTLTLCGFSTAASILLPRVMRALNGEFPDLSTRTIEADTSECYDFLLAGDADLGVTVVTSDTPARADSRFTQHFLFDDPLDLMVPRGHPLTRRASVSIADAAEETWIVGRPGTTYHQLVMANCASAGFTPQIGHYANDWNAGTALVSDGFGVCVASRLSRSHDLHPVERIPLTGEHAPTRHIAAITRTGAENRRAIRFSLDTLSRESERLMDQLGKDLDQGKGSAP